jgi:membrane protein DedA with SNARE-associated domain
MVTGTLLASAAIILLSFISEDAAAVSSALSIFGGPFSWRVGFVSCFAGIWLGDLGLYSLARCAGKNLFHTRWVRRFADPCAISRCEKVFSRHSSVALITSRFVPGTRLPTYLAAGLFGMPLRRFALITAIGGLVWVSGVFAVTKIFGTHVLLWFTSGQTKIAAVVLTGLVVSTAILLLRKARFVRTIAHQLGQWEFWPAWIFYIPVVVYYLFLAIRYRSFTLPTAANPGMQNGGFIGESKQEILKRLQEADAEFVADAYLLEGCTTSDRLLALHRLCRNHRIAPPFILKPDVGQRGNGVRLVSSLRDALDYLVEMDASVILQRYALGPREVGIFYYRQPGAPRGQIFSITEKLFPEIIGDGISTVEQLIRADSRASRIAATYLKRFASRQNHILAAGEVLKLVESGNHAQGCIFRDGSHLWSEELELRIDNISCRLPEFYFGRFDVRYETSEDLRVGRGFKIVELNGASSEATNIYDARNSLKSAYRTLFRQWRLVFEIGAANRNRGCAASPLRTLWRDWRGYCAAAATYPCAS